MVEYPLSVTQEPRQATFYSVALTGPICGSRRGQGSRMVLARSGVDVDDDEVACGEVIVCSGLSVVVSEVLQIDQQRINVLVCVVGLM